MRLLEEAGSRDSLSLGLEQLLSERQEVLSKELASLSSVMQATERTPAQP